MTTIVVDRKTRYMAADKLTSFTAGGGGTKFVSGYKIRRFSHEQYGDVLVGAAGASDAGEAFMLWYAFRISDKYDLKDPERDKDYPHTDDMQAVVLTNGGNVYWYGKIGYPIEIKDRFFGIGTGADFALGALHAGATIVEAVRIACKLDTNSGRGIQVEGFKNAKNN